MMAYDKDVAAFVIACYINDLPTWSSECPESNLAAARQLADDLGVRDAVERELRDLGSELVR
jgi:hypothetical protein